MYCRGLGSTFENYMNPRGGEFMLKQLDRRFFAPLSSLLYPAPVVDVYNPIIKCPP